MKAGGSVLSIAFVLAICSVIPGCNKDESPGSTPTPHPSITWQATGLSGGTVRALAINSTGAVFASLDGDGVYRTTDNGVTWSKVLNGPFQSAIGTGYADCLYVDGNTLWAGTDGAGMFRSTDDGTTWIEVNSGQPVGHVFDIEIGDALHVGSDRGIFRFDEQMGWIQLESNATYALLTIHEGWPSRCIYGGGPYQPEGDPGVIMWSSDGGSSWYRTAIRGIVRAFARGSDGTVFAATSVCYSGGEAYGVFRKKWQWYSWNPVCSGLETSDMSFESIAVSPADNLFIGSMARGVFCSTNSGDSWAEVNEGLTNLRVHELTINPSGYIYAGTDAGVFRGSF